MFINDYLYKNEIINKLLNENKAIIKNSNKELMALIISTDFKKLNKDIFVVCPTLFDAQKTYDELCQIVDEDLVLFFPEDELVASVMLDISGDFKYERINTLSTMINSKNKHIIVMNFNGAIKYEISKDTFSNAHIMLKKNMQIDPLSLIKKLEAMGYQNVYTITKTGEYAKRGEIIDIFPLNSDNPIRLDFFDDEIEKIKTFDVESQKSNGSISSKLIIPMKELIYDDEKLKIAIENISKLKNENNKEEIDEDILSLELHKPLENLMRYIEFFDNSKSKIFSYSDDYKIYITDYQKTKNAYDNYLEDIKNYSLNSNKALINLNYFSSIDEVIDKSNIIGEGVVNTFTDGYDFNVEIPIEYKSIEQKIAKDLKTFIKINNTLVFIKSELRLERLKEICLNEGVPYHIVNSAKDIKKDIVNIVLGYFPSINLKGINITILNEKTLFDVKYEYRKPKYKSIYKNTTKISSYDELKKNDFIVHYDYGIGRYKEIVTMESFGVLRDYLKIEYADGGMLYAPLEQISRIEKFTYVDEKTVKLTKLGTKQWEKSKEKVRKKIHDISDKLVKIYSSRMASTGFCALPDDDMQKAFEADFEYDLTKDQAKTIADIKRDMESDKVMDRLVCGDVGYGKTEVALRAAFKAIISGKQVALLCPTTILSRQHYYTFKERMEKYGVNVEIVNRFVKPKRLRQTLEDLKEGKVDVIVGTHKLLSSDVKYKDLGLLIVDEEQRFGVMHKEKIKEIKVNVDTITLSATPIPRTLQMSIVGIKDLSMIETPPKNRYPVQTYVIEQNDNIVHDAIMREMARGGQVFYLYNFVDSIYQVKERLEKLVPDARICVGHGQMDKYELEDVIAKFIDKEFDVLVSTTIIETGIDIPDTNTLIIDDASRLGLSQLYQLRGRVGRSDRIAYAYMMYPKRKVLSEDALRRLQTIKEFNELGSGYKIAMRDLAIRGAGDILGDEQSGFIESVGLEMYLEILNEELKKTQNKDENVIVKEPPTYELLADRHIDKHYIENEDVIIEIHKKIDKISSLYELHTLEEELIDRFGHIDDTTSNYMYEKLFHKQLELLDVDHIRNDITQVIIFLSKEKSDTMDGKEMFTLQMETSKELSLNYYNHQIQIIMSKRHYKDSSYLKVLCLYLDKLIK